MRKFLYKKNAFIGNSPDKSSGMKDIYKKDTKGILSSYAEKKDLMKKLKKYSGEGGVTKKELRMALAELKYGHDDKLTQREIRTLRKELKLKPITHRELKRAKVYEQQHGTGPQEYVSRSSRMTRAHNRANFKHRPNGGSHSSFGPLF